MSTTEEFLLEPLITKKDIRQCPHCLWDFLTELNDRWLKLKIRNSSDTRPVADMVVSKMKDILSEGGAEIRIGHVKYPDYSVQPEDIRVNNAWVIQFFKSTSRWTGGVMPNFQLFMKDAERPGQGVVYGSDEVWYLSWFVICILYWAKLKKDVKMEWLYTIQSVIGGINGATLFWWKREQEERGITTNKRPKSSKKT